MATLAITQMAPMDETTSPSVNVARWIEVVSHLDPRYGGLSAAVPDLARALTGSARLNVSVAAFCAPGEDFEPTGLAPHQLTYWPTSRRAWLEDRLHGGTLRKRFNRLLHGAAGVHIHGLWEQSTQTAAATARASRLPYIVSAHGMLEPWALANKRMKKLVYAAFIERKNVTGARCLHALTRAEAGHFVRFGARSPIAVIPNAVELPALADASLIVHQYPQLAGKRIVLFMARLHPKKGLDMLLEAWVAISPSFRDVHLLVAGPDSEGMLARMQEFIRVRGLTHSVTFAGMLSGASKWSALAAAEAFVLPSLSEGQSVGVLEAMGIGLPVIVTTPCNMPEVEQYRAGWQIQPDFDALLAALRALLQNDPAENHDLGRHGASLVQQRYTWPIVASQMAELYAWAAGGVGAFPSTLNPVFPGRT